MRKNRVLAAAAALGLALGASLIGASVAHADDSVTIDAPVDGSTIQDQTPDFSGFATPDATVQVFDESEATLCSTTADSTTGAWSCPPTADLAFGVHTVVAEAQVGSGSPVNTAPVTFTIEPVADAELGEHAPIYDFDTDLSLSGTTNFTLSSVTIEFADGIDQDCPFDADATGPSTWSCSYSSPDALPVGPATVTFAFATTAQTVGSSSFDVQPGLTFDAAPSVTTSTTELDFTGTAATELGDAMLSFADETTAECEFADVSTGWACSYSSVDGFPAGPAQLTVSIPLNSTTYTLPFLVIDPEAVPDVTLAFAPAGVVVTSAPTGPGTVAAVKLDPYIEVSNRGCPYGTEGPFDGIAPGVLTCSLTGLEAGYWDVRSFEDAGDGATRLPSEAFLEFLVLQTPTIDSVSGNAANVVTIAGGVGAAPTDPEASDVRATEGDRVHVVNGANTLCTAIVTASGTWSCSTAALPGGTYSLQAYVEDVVTGSGCECNYALGGLSAPSAPAVALTLPSLGGTSDGGSGSGPAGPVTPSWTFDLKGLDLAHVHPGDKFTITGAGLPAGAVITIELHSTPVSLGTVTVAPDGSFSLSGTIPSSVAPGAHHIVATLTGPGLAPTTVDKAITIEDASSTATTSTTSESTTEGDASGGTHEGGVVGDPGGAGDPLAPNVLTDGLQSIGDVFVHPEKIPSALAVGLVLLIFAVLPAHLLNATIAEQYDHLVRRVPRLGRTPRWLAGLRTWLDRAPVLGGLAVTTVTALLFGFADPRFGFTLASLRLFLAVAIALFIVVYLANAIAGRVVSKGWNVDVKLSVRPLGLVLTVIGVVISRALDFSPGFLIGLVLGLSIAGKSAASHAWKAVLVRSGVVITVALAAWIGYSAFPAGEHEGSTFFSELALEVLVAITTEGVVALLVELLPIRLLEGERLYKHSRPLWAAVYLALIVIFIVAVVPWEGNWAALGSSLWSWLAVVVIFGAVCVGIYLFFRIRSRNEHEDEHAGDELVSVSDNE